MSHEIDITSIDDVEDPRIAEAADQVISGLRVLLDNVDPEIASAFYDAVAEKLDELVDEASELAEAAAENEDDALLAEIEENPDEPPAFMRE